MVQLRIKISYSSDPLIITLYTARLHSVQGITTCNAVVGVMVDSKWENYARQERGGSNGAEKTQMGPWCELIFAECGLTGGVKVNEEDHANLSIQAWR